MVRLRSSVIHYAYESPHKDKSTRVFVCVYMRTRQRVCAAMRASICDVQLRASGHRQRRESDLFGLPKIFVECPFLARGFSSL